MNQLLPCQEWADKLIASHTEALSPSDYLVLKEHLLTCPDCMAVHHSYLLVEAQIRSLPVLQPQRHLSAQLLRETEMQKRAIQPQYASITYWTHALRKSAAVIFTIYIAPLKNLIVQLRKPGYALVALLFCLLTTVASIGTVNHLARTTTPSPAPRSPHLAVNNTGLALTISFVPTMSTSPTVTQKASLMAYGTLLLHNTGKQSLGWHFNSKKSFVVYSFSNVKIWTQPAYGTLQSNQRSPIQVIANGISYEELSLNHTVELGHIVLTSNEGDTSVQATLGPTQKTPSTPQTLSFATRDAVAPPRQLPYTIRQQSVSRYPLQS